MKHLIQVNHMPSVIKLSTVRRARAGRHTLCRSGFQPLPRLLRPRHSHIPVQHKWQVLTDRRFADGTEARATVQGRTGGGFDVKAGKLLTAERCRRGGEQRTRLL